MLIRKTITKILVRARQWWWIGALLLVNGALATLYPPDGTFFRWASQHAVQIMLCYLVLGLLLLLLRQRRLMFVSFACCAIICMYLRRTIGAEEAFRFQYAKPTQEKIIKFAHFNTGSTDGDFERVMQTLLKQNPDVISIQEVTPDWDAALRALLATKYPFFKSYRRIDFGGIALFSRFPFGRIDTFEVNHLPNIIGSLRIDSLHPEVFFISSHTVPPINTASFKQIRTHLQAVAERVRLINAPIFAFGDYNLAPWSSEVHNFQMQSELTDGRRLYAPETVTPTDYIFFSQHFNCLSFNDLIDKNGNHIGVEGSYQFKSDYKNVQKTVE